MTFTQLWSSKEQFYFDDVGVKTLGLGGAHHRFKEVISQHSDALFGTCVDTFVAKMNFVYWLQTGPFESHMIPCFTMSFKLTKFHNYTKTGKNDLRLYKTKIPYLFNFLNNILPYHLFRPFKRLFEVKDVPINYIKLINKL